MKEKLNKAVLMKEETIKYDSQNPKIKESQIVKFFII